MIDYMAQSQLYYVADIMQHMVHLGKNGKGMQKGQNCGIKTMDFML